EEPDQQIVLGKNQLPRKKDVRVFLLVDLCAKSLEFGDDIGSQTVLILRIQPLLVGEFHIAFEIILGRFFEIVDFLSPLKLRRINHAGGNENEVLEVIGE